MLTRKPFVGIFVCALLAAALGIPAAASATTPLVLSQSAALSILGASCGGIQETTYATGFDPSSGYPTGAVYLSTRCGGSGRGGGYRTTTHTAWAGVIWDFTGAVVSYGARSAPVNPASSAFDANGNQVYTASGNAYLVLAPGFVPAPRLTAVSPSSGPATGATQVVITGTGFTGATTVKFGGAPAPSFTVTSSTSITATSPHASAGTVNVTVGNSGGTSTPIASGQFTFIGAPTVTSMTPASGPVGGGTEVTITGSNFTGATQVTFGGAPAMFWVSGDSSITAIAPPAEAAGSIHVRVNSVGGRSVTTAADRFSYLVYPPAVTGVSPNIGPAGGGTWVTISGDNLAGATAVEFGGVPADFVVDSDTSITAISPAGAGSVDVTVTTAGGTSAPTLVDQFTFLEPPTVSSIDPNAGTVDGGDTVTITGTGLADVYEVDFGGVPAAFVVNDDGSITAISPAEAAGTVDVTVTGLGGSSTPTAADEFTYA